LTQLFLNREEEGQEELLQQKEDEADNQLEQNVQPVDKEKKEKKGKELTDDEVWELAKMLNASQEGLSKPKNKIILEYMKTRPHLSKRTIDRKIREIALSVYLVDPRLFESLVNSLLPRIFPKSSSVSLLSPSKRNSKTRRSLLRLNLNLRYQLQALNRSRWLHPRV
jgi:hypothetical protein